MSKKEDIMESKEGFFGEDSLIASFQSNYENPILTSIERNYDPQNVIVEKTIYKEPKYKKDKNVYEEKEPIINNIIYLPEAKNNKDEREMIFESKNRYNKFKDKELHIMNDEIHYKFEKTGYRNNRKNAQYVFENQKKSEFRT